MSRSDTHGLGPLFERSRHGDDAARGELLLCLRAYLKALARSWLGTELARRLDASSIAQESVVRIEAHWADLRGQTVPQLLAWARRIAHNVAADRVRRLGSTPAAADEAEDVPAPDAEPLDLLVGEEEAARVAAALEELSPPRREVIVARLLDGLPFEAVATRMGKQCGAVRVLFMRAVEQLRQILESES